MQILRKPLNCLLMLALVGCASYEPSRTTIPAVGTGVARISDAGVTVAAEPCIDPELQLSLFDADLNEAGIVAINVLVRNETNHAVVAERTDMNLVLPDGRQLRPISAQTAAAQVGEGGSPTAMLLSFGIVGSLAADNAEEMARTARTTDYTLKQFDGSAIAANGSAQGYVYFSPSITSSGTDPAHLDVRIHRAGETTSTTLAVPISNAALRVKGTPKAVPTHTIR